MESTRQNQLLLPAAYAPISEEEMIYIEGGDSISPQQFVYNASTNLIRLIGQAIIERTFTGIQNMRDDGLTVGGAVKHYWNGQPTRGKVMTFVFAGFAGYAFYVRAVQLINTALALYTEVKDNYLNNNASSTTNASASTDVTAATTAALTAA